MLTKSTFYFARRRLLRKAHVYRVMATYFALLERSDDCQRWLLRLNSTILELVTMDPLYCIQGGAGHDSVVDHRLPLLLTMTRRESARLRRVCRRALDRTVVEVSYEERSTYEKFVDRLGLEE